MSKNDKAEKSEAEKAEKVTIAELEKFAADCELSCDRYARGTWNVRTPNYELNFRCQPGQRTFYVQSFKRDVGGNLLVQASTFLQVLLRAGWTEVEPPK